jgi:hypothetical protein
MHIYLCTILLHATDDCATDNRRLRGKLPSPTNMQQLRRKCNWVQERQHGCHIPAHDRNGLKLLVHQNQNHSTLGLPWQSHIDLTYEDTQN